MRKKKNGVYVATARVREGAKAKDIGMHAGGCATAAKGVSVCVKENTYVEKIRAKMRTRVGKCV